MRKIMIAAAVVVCITAFSGSALACSCIGGLSIQTQFSTTDAVFVGEIVATKHNVNQSLLQGRLLTGPGTIDATFKVTRAVKGTLKVGDTVTIQTSDQETACGIVQLRTQTPGTSWIVYAHWLPGALLWQTGFCSRTKPAASPAAKEDFQYFDLLQQAR